MIPRSFVVLLLVGTMMSKCLTKPTFTATADDDTPNTIADQGGHLREQYARLMLSYMNLSVQPCDDFYEYACGNWKHTIQPRQTEKKRDHFYEMVFKMDDFVGSILQRSDINDVAPEYAAEFELAKKFHNKCMNSELYPMHKSSDYLEIIEKIGGFPAVNPTWDVSQFNWINMSAHLSSYGVKNLINELTIASYPFNPIFPLPDFGFDIDLHYDTIANISSNEYRRNKKKVHDILALYDVAANKIERVIGDIFAFLTATLSVVAKFGETQYKCDELSETLDDSDVEVINQQWMPYFDIVWKGKFSKLGPESGPCFYFYHEFNKIAEQHQEAMANYLALKFLYHMDANLKGATFQQDFCNSSLRLGMQLFFDHLYMKIAFKKEMSDDVSKMFKELQKTLRTMLQEADWLDESTREAALKKVAIVGLSAGRYEDPAVTERLLGELKNLQFVDGSYEANRLNLERFANYMARYYGLHIENFSNRTRSLKLLVGMEVNAFFYQNDNTVYTTAALLQPPVYHQSWPNSLKYGTLGFVVGHEFAHGFDTSGRRFDHTGESRNWWSDESAKMFDERARSFVEFYSNYTVPEINRHINGDLTQNENMADAGALNMALRAYRRYAEEESMKFDSMAAFYKTEQMPGVDASPEQLLFLGAAQLWCASYTEADYWRHIMDDHTIDKYRVWGMVSNNDDFAKAYNCPVGSNMNPTTDKCHIF